MRKLNKFDILLMKYYTKYFDIRDSIPNCKKHFLKYIDEDAIQTRFYEFCLVVLPLDISKKEKSAKWQNEVYQNYRAITGINISKKDVSKIFDFIINLHEDLKEAANNLDSDKITQIKNGTFKPKIEFQKTNGIKVQNDR